MHKHLPHLSKFWSSNPIFFITTCTYHREPILACEQNAQILIDEWRSAYERHGWLVGRYVIMPDHVHFFCAFEGELSKTGHNSLSYFMQNWKQWTSKRMIKANLACPIRLSPPVWQKEFIDHLLRSEENYRQKWLYVVENPVRKELISNSEDWPWQGEIFVL